MFDCSSSLYSGHFLFFLLFCYPFICVHSAFFILKHGYSSHNYCLLFFYSPSDQSWTIGDQRLSLCLQLALAYQLYFHHVRLNFFSYLVTFRWPIPVFWTWESFRTFPEWREEDLLTWLQIYIQIAIKTQFSWSFILKTKTEQNNNYSGSIYIYIHVHIYLYFWLNLTSKGNKKKRVVHWTWFRYNKIKETWTFQWWL